MIILKLSVCCTLLPHTAAALGNHLMDSTNNNFKKNRRQKRLHTKASRRLKLTYLKMLRINDPPERIARGAAIGVCMGILPTFGAGLILAFVLALVLKANKGAAVLGSFIMNPLTSAFFWSGSLILGSLITGQNYTAIMGVVHENGILRGAGWTYAVFLVGNVIITGVFTVGAYFIVRWAVVRHREKKARRRLEKNGSPNAL